MSGCAYRGVMFIIVWGACLWVLGFERGGGGWRMGIGWGKEAGLANQKAAERNV